MKCSRALVILFAAAWTAAPVQAQMCSFSIGGLNRARTVTGPVHAECPGSIHSAPFGNWGASSPFGSKRNGHQFDGWCYNTWVMDNYGRWTYDCRDGWYEWNSCTDIPQYQAPNCTLYNSASCTQQTSSAGPDGIDIVGSYYGSAWSSCPYDTDSDGYCDEGGCRDFDGIYLSYFYMSLYELDPICCDQLVQSVYFPATWVPLKGLDASFDRCTPWGCTPSGSDWVSPSMYDSPSWPPRVSALFAVAENYGFFSDPYGTCARYAQVDPKYNCR